MRNGICAEEFSLAKACISQTLAKERPLPSDGTRRLYKVACNILTAVMGRSAVPELSGVVV